MSWVILIVAAVLLAILEKFWTPAALKALRMKGSCDRMMAEPGECVTWRAEIENHSRLPIPFVRLQESFPSQAQICGEPNWISAHCRVGIQQWNVEEKLWLMPLQSCTKKVSFSFARRGVYQVGGYRLSAGDLLGFHEKSRDGESQPIVIIPARCHNRQALLAVGGFLGDISVRRFILEDPVLTVGFRDYTGREPMKAISWTRTAKTGTLQVKQFDHTAEQTVIVILNVEGAGEEELEECFRLTRMACEELEKKKVPYGFRTNGNLPCPTGKLFLLPEGLGSSHLNTILYGLGQADNTCFLSFRSLVNQTLRRRKNNESYLLVTPPLTERDRSSLQELEAAAVNPVCVLTGKAEGDET